MIVTFVVVLIILPILPINANSASPRPEGAKLIEINPQLIDHHTLFVSIIDPNLGPVGLQITTMVYGFNYDLRYIT